MRRRTRATGDHQRSEIRSIEQPDTLRDVDARTEHPACLTGSRGRDGDDVSGGFERVLGLGEFFVAESFGGDDDQDAASGHGVKGTLPDDGMAS